MKKIYVMLLLLFVVSALYYYDFYRLQNGVTKENINLFKKQGEDISSAKNSNTDVEKLFQEIPSRYGDRKYERILKSFDLVHGPIDISWNNDQSIKDSQISFYQLNFEDSVQMDTYVDHSNGSVLYGFLTPTPEFSSDKGERAKKIMIDKYDDDGGPAKVESFFLANADNDKNLELVVLISWRINSYDTTGTYYKVYVYDDNFNIKNDKLMLMQNITDKFPSECDCTGSGRDHAEPMITTFAKFKTSESIKLEIKKLGY